MKQLLMACFILLSLPTKATSLPEKDATETKPYKPIWYLNILLVRAGSEVSDFRILVSRAFSKHHEISAGAEFMFREPKAMPSGGSCLSCPHGNPKDYIHGLSATYGYLIYPFPKTNWFRLALRTGILLGSSIIRSDFEKSPSLQFGEDDYRFWQDNLRWDAGFLLSPTVEILGLHLIGLSVGPYVFLNPRFQNAGISFNVLFGNLRKP